MRVAIPTDDGLHISTKCERAKGFFVAHIENGRIIKEEIRWNPNPDPADPRTAALAVIEDCSVVIAGDQLHNCINMNPAPDKEFFIVREKIITNVMVDYLTMTLMRESNTSCCP
ncbi:MAG: NifB/NifX family molybdenum-iron cluster-binding protein [Bacteroidales bacterium]